MDETPPSKAPERKRTLKDCTTGQDVLDLLDEIRKENDRETEKEAKAHGRTFAQQALKHCTRNQHGVDQLHELRKEREAKKNVEEHTDGIGEETRSDSQELLS